MHQLKRNGKREFFKYNLRLLNNKSHLKLSGFFLFFLLCFFENAYSQYSLDSVEFYGRFKIKKSVLLREIEPYKPGAKVEDTAEARKKVYEQLLGLELFNRIEVNWEIKEELTILKIGLWENFPVFPEGNLEFADRNSTVWIRDYNWDLRRINIGLGAKHKNLFGKRQELGAFAQIGFTPKMRLSYRNPYLDKDKKHGWEMYFSWSKNNEIPIKTQNNKQFFYKEEQSVLEEMNLELNYIYRPEFSTEFKAGLTFLKASYSDKIWEEEPNYIPVQKPNYWTIKIPIEFRYNKVDYWNYPLEGWRVVVNSNLYIPLSQQGFWWPIAFQADYYVPIENKIYLSYIFRTQWSVLQDKNYNYQENLGYGFHYVRGFEPYVIDGRGFVLGRQNVKYKILDWKYSLNWKFFETVPLQVFLKGFTDAGFYIGHKGMDNNKFKNPFLGSAGIGIDILTLYGLKFRFEYSINSIGNLGFNFHRSGE